jgi:hypothetical protein
MVMFLSCGDVKPKEHAATIGRVDMSWCGYCGGWFVTTDSSTWYRAEIPEPFNKENTKAWTRFTHGETEKDKLGRRIKITSIRER